MNNIEPNNNRLLETLETYAGELTEKVELVRVLGDHLISLVLQGDIDYPVEWIVRSGIDDPSLIENELTLRARRLSIALRNDRTRSPLASDDLLNEDIPFHF